ncbi:hypothetical protein [Burkholderia ubonensis]|uniref:hypothetical protein n=1 Tax=Burkholderia ubonensis TaxID=101571 RepID=UPI000AD9870C|nr:hypothetical protein [Burkholderia ubonensis]
MTQSNSRADAHVTQRYSWATTGMKRDPEGSFVLTSDAGTKNSRADALTEERRQALGEALTEYFATLDSDAGIRAQNGRILRTFDYCDSRHIDDLIDRTIVPALTVSPVEQPAVAPDGAEPPHHIVDAAMKVARHQYRHGVTRASTIAIWEALEKPWYAVATSANETGVEGAADLNERAHLAAGQWANANTPISEALAYRDGYIAGAHSPAMAAAAPLARKTRNPHRGGTQAYLATEHFNEGWNACLDEIAAYNECVVAEGTAAAQPAAAPADERAECIAWANANGFTKYHESMCAAWEERARRAAASPAAEDDNSITLDRRDLFDFVRGAIKSTLQDYKAGEGMTPSWYWQEATNRTEAVLEALDTKSPYIEAAPQPAQADAPADARPKCHGCPINPTCPSISCGAPADAGEPIGQHDLSTSTGGRRTSPSSSRSVCGATTSAAISRNGSRPTSRAR